MFTIAIRTSIRSRGIQKAGLKVNRRGRRERGGGRKIEIQNSASPAFSAVNKKMQIVRAKPEEADALTDIAHAAKRHWGYPERWIESWRDILTMRPQFIADNVTYCAKDDGRIIGFYLLTTEGDGMHL